MSTIYKFEDLLSFQDLQLGSGDEFEAWDIFGKFDPAKKRLDNLLGDDSFLERISSVLNVEHGEDTITIKGNTIALFNNLLLELDKEENYTWPEIASTCFFLGRNLDVIVKKVNKLLHKKYSPAGEDMNAIEESMQRVEKELEELKSELELLRDAGII